MYVVTQRFCPQLWAMLLIPARASYFQYREWGDTMNETFYAAGTHRLSVLVSAMFQYVVST